MKHILLLFIITSAFAARANDTLTRAQIYNFNVGDTFDYMQRLTYFNAPLLPNEQETVAYSRCIINSIYYSVTNDTLFIIRRWIYPQPVTYDTLIIDSLQYPVSLVLGPDSCQAQGLFINSASNYNNLIANEITGNCRDAQYTNYAVSYQYCTGLGLSSSVIITEPFEGDDITDSIYIIYHTKADSAWGTPYYIADSSQSVNYIPIPEQCASWVSNSCLTTSICNVCYPAPQKVTTGNRIAFMGHTYVELLFTAEEGNSVFTTDSLIGYFRNDTLNQKAYVYNSWMGVQDALPILIYDFSVPAGGPVISLSQVEVGGQLRTVWNEVNLNTYLGATPSYIEGVGGVGGIFPFTCQITYVEGYPEYVTSTLTCFSVCGQTLYPYDSTANCGLAAINNVAPITPQIKVYPTINNGLFNVEVLNQSLQDAQLLITDVTGRQIKRCAFNSQLNNISIQQYTSGMYIWQVLSHDKLVQAGKLIKE